MLDTFTFKCDKTFYPFLGKYFFHKAASKLGVIDMLNFIVILP